MIRRNNIVFVGFFILSLLVTSTRYGKALTIVANLKPNQKITFFYGGEKICRLINNTKYDTTIIRRIAIETLTEFRYGIIYSQNNESVRIRHTMLLSPTDSLIFAKEGHEIIPLNRKAESIFLDKHIVAGYYSIMDTANSVKNPEEDFVNYLLQQKYNLKKDSIKIENLLHLNVISKEQQQRWLAFRKVTYLANIFKTLKEGKINAPGKMHQILFNEGISFIKNYRLEGDAISVMVSHLSSYWIAQHNVNSKAKPVDFIDFYLRNGVHKSYIRNYFISYLKNANDKLSLRYENNSAKIRKYALETDTMLFNKLDIGSPGVFTSLEKVVLINPSGVTDDLRRVFSLSDTKYFLIDIWASWCVPCRQQLPDFEKFKREFDRKDITFISISIDKNKVDWLRALEEEKTSGQRNQFKLLNHPTSSLIKYFGIATIPRYLILDNEGKVVSDRFYLPTDKEFKPELLKILN